MITRERIARESVIEGVKRLLSDGLVERTWGNISARIDSEYFIITPSGLDYNKMGVEDLVKVKIDDLSYEGDNKPSSEKGIHAYCYMDRSDVNFVIHTHQCYATAISQLECEMFGAVPAKYAISSTKALRKNVSDAITRNPNTSSFYLVKHGALFLARDVDDAFTLALTLEEQCKTEVLEKLYNISAKPKARLYSSRRNGIYFFLDRGEGEEKYRIDDNTLAFPISLHQRIYNADGSIRYIEENQSDYLTELSIRGKAIKPLVDDMAQAVGTKIRCIKEDGNIESAIKGRNAVLISGYGSLIYAKNKEDVKAFSSLLEIDAINELYAREENSYKPLGFIDANVQRLVYTKKYSKKKDD